MLAPASAPQETLPAGHPCESCEVRYHAVCSVLGCADLARFKKLGRTVTLTPGQTLFHEGDPATRVFTLTRGTMKLYKLLADGRRHVAAFLHPGDVIGSSPESEQPFTAEALEEAQLCWFPRSGFEGFVESHTAMERELYRVARDELAAAQQHLVLLGRKTAMERVATFLLELARVAGRMHVEEVRVVRLPMSRCDIADHLGLTKETVSRMLSALRRARIIRLAAVDEVEILDAPALEERAEPRA